MFCAKCGQNNPEQSKFCQGCGAPILAAAPNVQSPPPQPAAAPKKNQAPIFIIALGVVILAAIAVLFALRSNLFKSPPIQPGVMAAVAATPVKNINPKVILLISEQNIEGPQNAWWASQIDLSVTEATVAQKIIQAGFVILEPSQLNNEIKLNPAFSMVGINEVEAVKLGNLSKAQYVVLGKAVATAGGNVPDSNMRSCFANISAKLIRVKDGSVLAYLDASGNSAHLDVITGGKEALVRAANDLAGKIVEALNKDSGK